MMKYKLMQYFVLVVFVCLVYALTTDSYAPRWHIAAAIIVLFPVNGAIAAYIGHSEAVKIASQAVSDLYKAREKENERPNAKSL